MLSSCVSSSFIILCLAGIDSREMTAAFTYSVFSLSLPSAFALWALMYFLEELISCGLKVHCLYSMI
jgi:hypothetical protein